MKKLLLIFASFFALLSASAQTSSVSLWDEANTAYIGGDYAKAIEYYDSIMDQGYASYKLYYNLGNAYFKQGNIGRSILNYERALDLAPTDADVRHNLEVVNGYVKDNIAAMPEFFLSVWMREIKTSFSSNAWAGASIVFFALMLASVLLYLLSVRIRLRKTGFYSAIAALCLFVMSVSFSVGERNRMLDSDEAIVMQASISVKSSPDGNSKELFIIREGTKVRVMRSIGEMVEIMIADGNKGWVNSEAIEKI